MRLPSLSLEQSYALRTAAGVTGRRLRAWLMGRLVDDAERSTKLAAAATQLGLTRAELGDHVPGDWT